MTYWYLAIGVVYFLICCLSSKVQNMNAELLYVCKDKRFGGLIYCLTWVITITATVAVWPISVAYDIKYQLTK